MKLATLFLGFLFFARMGPAVELVQYESCPEGQRAFEKTVHLHVRTHCIKCHEQGPGPRFATPSPDESYAILLAKTHFSSPGQSRLQTKGGDGHCLDNGYDCKTDEKVIADLISRWWEDGQKQCRARTWKQFEPQTIVPEQLPGRIEFPLDVPGATLSIEIDLKAKTETIPYPLYVLKSPRLKAGSQGVTLKGIQFLLNGNAFGYPDSFESLEGRISAESTQTLSSQSIVIPKTEAGPDQLTLAMESVHASKSASRSCQAFDLFKTNVYPLMDYRCSVCHGVSGRGPERPTNARKYFPIPIEGQVNDESLARLCQRSLERIDSVSLLDSPLFRLAFGGDRVHRNVASLLDESIPKDVKRIYPDWFEWAIKEREMLESK